MKSYPSYIDGHPISCKPLPTEKNESAAAFIRLIKLPIQGAGQPTHSQKTLNVWIDGTHVEKDRVFYIGKNFEYFDGRQSLTDVLLLHHKISPEKVKVQITSSVGYTYAPTITK